MGYLAQDLQGSHEGAAMLLCAQEVGASTTHCCRDIHCHLSAGSTGWHGAAARAAAPQTLASPTPGPGAYLAL